MYRQGSVPRNRGTIDRRGSSMKLTQRCPNEAANRITEPSGANCASVTVKSPPERPQARPLPDSIIDGDRVCWVDQLTAPPNCPGAKGTARRRDKPKNPQVVRWSHLNLDEAAVAGRRGRERSPLRRQLPRTPVGHVLTRVA